MNRLKHIKHNHKLRASRTRARLHGSAERPRLNVHVSLRHISAQLIDDTAGHTLVYATTVGREANKGSLTEKATRVGSEIAKAAQKANLKQVVFDRGARAYHGRVKALAEAARKEGLEF